MSSNPSPRSSPVSGKPAIGGQAIVEGVMMRGPLSWAIAVRKPNSEIVTETHMLPGHAQKHPWLKWPFVRGFYVLVEQLSIGMKALKKSAAYSIDEEVEEGEMPSDRMMNWTMGIAMIFFMAIFIATPALAVKFAGRSLNVDSSLIENIVEGLVRIGMFIGYILLISLLPSVRRVFQYHGAEHKTIYAYENDDPLEPEVVDRYSTLHVRCGTNFLFIVMFLTIVVHFLMDLVLPASIPIRVGARLAAVPLIAGMAYEVIKAASRNEDSVALRIASLPGLAMQKITTRPPDPDQIEVAIKAMEAVIGRESLAQPARAAAEESQAASAHEAPPVVSPQPGTAPAGPG